MKILGLDPSTKTGAVVLDDSGAVLYKHEWLTDPREDTLYRANEQANHLLDLINLHEPDLIVIEDYIRNFKNPNVAIQLITMGAILRYFLREMDYPWVEVAPTAMKKFVTGAGNSNKEDIKLNVYKLWGFEHKSNNVVDAYALAQMGRYHLTGGGTRLQKEVIKKAFATKE